MPASRRKAAPDSRSRRPFRENRLTQGTGKRFKTPFASSQSPLSSGAFYTPSARSFYGYCVGFSKRRLLPHRDGLSCRRPRGCLEERKLTHQRQRRSGLVNPTFARRKQKVALKCAAVSSFGASKARFLLITRKRLIATASRREGVYNRAGEPSVTFCGEEERRRARAAAKDAAASGAESATTTQRRKWEFGNAPSSPRSGCAFEDNENDDLKK